MRYRIRIMNKTLKVGDVVYWRGCFGMAEPRKAMVTAIQVQNPPGSKHGNKVFHYPWSKITGRNVLVDLGNNSWAWAHQIKPL